MFLLELPLMSLPQSLRNTKTFTKHEVTRKWRLIDAEGKILGRLATEIANAFYEYQNLSLVAEVQTPDPSDLAKLQKSGGGGGTFEYNSISSYYTTFNSTNAIINFSLGLSRVLSVFCNFML